MRRGFGLLFALVALVLVIHPGSGVRLHASSEGGKLVKPAKLEVVEKSMHEFMEYVFEPAYLRLKANMAVKEKTKKEWKGIKSDALILAESSNLLLLRLPDKKAGDWAKQSTVVREAGALLYQAARKKDEKAAMAAYRDMLVKCNACHKQFAEGKHQLQP